MYKTTLPFAVVATLVLTSCNYRVQEIDRTPESAQVSVRVSGFDISIQDLPSTRALQDVDSYTSVGAITLAFYSDETQVFKATQIKSDQTSYTTFGDFSCNLPLGTYTVVALGYYYSDGDVLALTSPTQASYTSERPRETFAATGTVNLTTAEGYELQLELDRITSKLQIISTDGRPADITRIRTSFSAGSKSFNPTTGLALDDEGFSQTNNPSKAAGQAIDISLFPFLTSQEQLIDITIQTMDAAQNVVSTHVINDVPFEINRATILKGPLFSATMSSTAFQLETAWLDPVTILF